MDEQFGNLEPLIQEKMESDADFQATLATLPDEEHATAIAEKKAEILAKEYAAALEKAKKAEEIARNQEIRAKKAESLAKTTKADTTAPKNYEEIIKDSRALHDVPEEDVDEILKHAKNQSISITEAKNSPYIKWFLKTKAEERASAAVANTASTKRVNKADADALLEKANSGADMSDEEMREAAQLRLQQKKAK